MTYLVIKQTTQENKCEYIYVHINTSICAEWRGHVWSLKTQTMKKKLGCIINKLFLITYKFNAKK